jgi:hypothetical protein
MDKNGNHHFKENMSDSKGKIWINKKGLESHRGWWGKYDWKKL